MSDEFREKIAGEITLAAEPGKTIRKWREEFGLSQYELADAMEVSHSVISDYESGRRKSPGAGLALPFALTSSGRFPLRVTAHCAVAPFPRL